MLHQIEDIRIYLNISEVVLTLFSTDLSVLNEITVVIQLYYTCNLILNYICNNINFIDEREDYRIFKERKQNLSTIC